MTDMYEGYESNKGERREGEKCMKEIEKRKKKIISSIIFDRSCAI
jgi:hypothetical protein